MHSAPAVRYPVARSARAGALLLGVWAAAAAMCFWWWSDGGPSAWHWLVALASLSIGAAFAFVQWHQSPVGRLRWDGEAWWWQFFNEDEIPVSIQVRLDLQRGMLLEMAGLRLHRAWCYVERASLPPYWADLRRALSSPASATAPRSGNLSP